MTGRAVVPIRDMARRIPEAGRIRFGIKTGRAMKALSTFRFTSHDREALEQIAGLYGGTVNPWSDPKAAEGQFEVITEASEIRIVLPPDPLGGTPIYELWGGGGCEKRCDGLTAQIVTRGPDGAEMTDVPCVCAAQGSMSCEPRTRLSVILPEIRFGGVWRLETKSWNAAQEMPGMVGLIQSLQERGLTRGVLALKHRRSVTAGETHRFIVPVLGVDETIDALASGAAQVGALGSAATVPPVAALSAGEPEEERDAAPDVETPPAPNLDDEVIDAEVIDDHADLEQPPADDGEPMASNDDHTILRAAIGYLPDATRDVFLTWWKAERLPSIKDTDSLTVRQYERIMTYLSALEEADSPSAPAQERRDRRAERAQQAIDDARAKLQAASQ
jgi:hypothetical protein